MADFLKGFLDNLESGVLNPKGNLGDYQHGARLYVDDAFRLAPKTKYLYHVTLNINPRASAVIPQLTEKHSNEINMLVKSADLPKYNIQTEVKHQYNKKRVVQKRLDYQPVNIAFHDDNFGITTAMWEAYYRYYYKDGNYAAVNSRGDPETSVKEYKSYSNAGSEAFNRGAIFNNEKQYRYGFDNDSFEPFFESIVIYQMSRKRYTAFTLVNPLIANWNHDTMDQQAGSSEGAQSNMTIEYETVFYTRGPVTEGSAPKGFATEHYDKIPSPLSLSGGGTSSLFGAGGVVSGGLGVLGDIVSGNAFSSPGALLGTVLRSSNIKKNLKNLSKEGLRQEGISVLGKALTNVQRGGTGGIGGLSFPKSIGEAKSIASSIGAGSFDFSGNPLGDVSSALNSDPAGLDNLAKATNFKKDHLRAGGSANVNAINEAYANANQAVQDAAKDTASSNLANIIRTP